MSEVSTEPPAREVFSQGDFKDLDIPEVSEQQLKELSLDQIRGILKGSIGRQLKQAKDDPEMQKTIMNVAVASFGPLAYKPERIIASTEDPVVKEGKARLQQTLVHSIYYAGLPSAEETFSETIYGMVHMMEILNKREEADFDNLKIWWKGVKIELAVVKALKANNFKVYLPNYSNGSPEVMLFDITSGIDMMAFSPNFNANTVICIDATGGGTHGLKKTVTSTEVMTPESLRLQKWPQVVVERLRGKTDRKIVRAVAEVYAGRSESFSPLLDLPDKKEALRNFGYLHQDDENAIINPLKQYSKQYD